LRRFPLRTLLLMVLALLAFARMWWVTHSKQRPEARPLGQTIEVTPLTQPPAGGDR
jgi:hypothetical protein